MNSSNNLLIKKFIDYCNAPLPSELAESTEVNPAI